MTTPFKRIAFSLSSSLIILVATMAGLPAAGFASEMADKEVLYWYDPMMPQHKFDKPGKSPFMDMDLVPRYADEAGNGATMSIDPGITQNLGMRLATVQRESMNQSFRAAATLAFNDRDVAIVQARSSGFVERVYDLAPEDVIAKGAPLVDIFVPAWAAAQEEYLAISKVGDAQLLAAAKQRLRLAGMPTETIEQLQRSGKARPVWTVTSPIGGTLKTLDVRQGMTVQAGESLASVNGLDTVWLEVAVPEAQVTNLAPGQSITVHLPAFAGEPLEATIQSLLSQANLDSRTVRVRAELPNPEQRLRPGMTAEVTLNRNIEHALVVPAEAVIRTGRRALVMLAEAEGRYRPIEVRTGRELGDKTEILDGLEAGQTVVASGQFLLDSEASLRGLTAQTLEDVDHAHGPVLHEAEGEVVGLEDGMVGLSHGPFKTLHMPGMTMAFPVADASLLEGVQVGSRVRVAVRESDEGLIIEHIETLEAPE
ncbi:efflux RND transporter periplasmic adaptor subunit [Halopseudomonas bauzanensis]|uniref:Membrane fusion protein, Cu(I)/Ag(I) efflux system n=1 Tax=Halopseudomonas bauzanensis TaxID=653930 RepID=A0A1I4KQU0_9GAMM|nr:efflux RND transporter periplasmic adaptor subunit [Halopseudomonas bauzanensis]SER35480.1 membrane fusion protein, Cu(I)/Ag(I) efflux system [Halopseudomonas bauzanensis]SFL80919.1 membrane fusion protein, Cu(I)/Ag(I) efflux system [Halopseudomonas bauzanensis]